MNRLIERQQTVMAPLNEQIYICGVKLLIVSLGLILAAILFPYDFSLVSEVKLSGSSNHLLNHIVLFVPFGFALACLLQKTERGSLKNLLLIVVGGICVPVVVEVLQIFVTTRSASFGDMLANSGGVLVGVIVFVLFGDQLVKHALRIGRRARKFLTAKFLVGTALAYVIAICFLSAVLQRTTSLSTWDDSFPLLVGNEPTGDRPWQGHVYQLQMTDRSLSEHEIADAFAEDGLLARIDEPVLASYRLMHRGDSYPDHSGHLPELVWVSEMPENGDKQHSLFGVKQWLATPTSAAPLSQAIKKTSRFTFSSTVASAAPEQWGPARIVSVSSDHRHRNFTLGQEGSSLVVRLRTTLTGKNGMRPDLVIPHVFIDDEPRHIVITYDGAILRAFINGVQHPRSLELVPAATLSGYWFAVTADNIKGHKVLYYGLLFTPLGFLAGFVSKTLKYSVSVKYVIAGAGIIVPAVILEIVLTIVNGTVRTENLILGILFTAGGILPVVSPPNTSIA